MTFPGKFSIKSPLVSATINTFLLSIFAVSLLLFLTPLMTHAQVLKPDAESSAGFVRSLETLRDLDYKSWQVVAYKEDLESKKAVLRIIGYPGQLRLDHPTDLKVYSGRREWILRDVTLLNPILANDARDAAAEFELSSLLSELTNNRPLRLELPGAFTEMPVPPYLVKEWRSVFDSENTL